MTLSASNGYSGGTVLNQGTLVVTTSAALGPGPVSFNGGTFEYNSSTGSIPNNITVAAGTVTTITDLQALTLTGTLRGTGTLFENPPGGNNNKTFTLSGDNSNFTGTIVYNFNGSNGDNLDFGGTQLSNDLGGVTLVGENEGGRRLAPAAGTTVQLGALVGSVELVSGTIQVGSLNTNATFNGISVSPYAALTKVGTGTWTLNSQGLTVTSLNVNNGAMLVDLSNVPSPTNFFASDPLTLNGGKLVIRGKGTALQNSSQAFSGTTIAPGSSAIVSDNNGGNGTVVTLAAITRNAGGAVDFTLPSGTQSATYGITTTSTANATYGVMTSAGSTSNPIAYATVNGGAGWASLSGSNVVPLASYATGNANYTSTNNVDVTNGDSVTGVTVNTLRFNSTPTIGLTLAGANTVATGGILATPNATAATISGGSLQTGGGNEFVFDDYGNLTVSSQLVNSGTTALTKAGSGTLVLSNANNTYNGATYLNGGITNIAADTSVGTATVAFNGSALQLALDYAATLFSNNRSLTVNYNGGTIDTNGNNVVYNGVISSPNASTGANSNYDGQFNFTKAGAGTLTLTQANTYYGATIINGGVLSVASIATEGDGGGVASGIGEAPNYARGLVLNGGTLQYTGGGATTDRLFTLGDSGGGLDAFGGDAINYSNTGAVAYQINSSGGPTNSSPTLTLSGTNTGANILAAAIGNNGLGTTSLVKNGAGSWTLTGVNSYSGTTTVNGGTLQLAGAGTFGTVSASLTVNSGAAVAPAIFQAAVTLAGSSAKLSLTNSDSFPAVGTTRSAIGSLNFGGTTGAWTGLANLGGTGVAITGAMITTNSAGLTDAPTVRSQLIQGYNNGTWTGTAGITSSLAAANTANLSVGYYVSGSIVTVAAAIPGDTTLKGAVDNLDRTVLLQSLSSSTVQGVARWQDGSFDYSGYVDTKDISLFLSHQGDYISHGQVVSNPPQNGPIQPAGGSPGGIATVSYNPVTGLLTLDDSGANYEPPLAALSVYMPSTGTTVVTGMTGDISGSGTWSGRNLANHELMWYSNSLGQVTLPAGDYTLARLATGLPSAAFSGSSALGAVFSTDANGDSNATAVTIAPQVSGNWTAPGGGTWSTSGNWDTAPNVPGAGGRAGDTATFGSSIGSSSATITLDELVALAALAFSNKVEGCCTLNGVGSNALTFNNSGGGATIAVNAGSHVIDTAVVLADNLTVSGSGTLAFGAASSITDNGSGFSLTINGEGGTLVLSGSDSYTGGTIVDDGTLIVTNANAIEDGTNLTVGNANAFAPVIPNLPSSPSVAPVPEPSTLALLVAGAALMAIYRKRR